MIPTSADPTGDKRRGAYLTCVGSTPPIPLVVVAVVVLVVVAVAVAVVFYCLYRNGDIEKLSKRASKDVRGTRKIVKNKIDFHCILNGVWVLCLL